MSSLRLESFLRRVHCVDGRKLTFIRLPLSSTRPATKPCITPMSSNFESPSSPYTQNFTTVNTFTRRLDDAYKAAFALSEPPHIILLPNKSPQHHKLCVHL